MYLYFLVNSTASVGVFLSCRRFRCPSTPEGILQPDCDEVQENNTLSPPEVFILQALSTLTTTLEHKIPSTPTFSPRPVQLWAPPSTVVAADMAIDQRRGVAQIAKRPG